MIKKIFGFFIILILIFGFYSSKNFGPISGGIALFLFGMIFLGQGFKELTGGGFEKILNKLTNRTWKSMTLGAVGATVMQSSSLVTIIAISFLSAELIPLAQAIAISIGSNIGTTTGAWIMAQLGEKAGGLSAYAMPIIVFGLLLFLQKSKNIKGIGNILLGIGIIFIGVGYITDGFKDLKESIDFMKYSVDGFYGILIFTIVGTILTLLLQSSHASILIILTALAANQLTLENALGLTIGANIGTTFTAILGSINSNVNGRRLAVADVIFKGITGIIFLIFIYQIIPIVNMIANGLNLENPAFKVAIFHTLFNVTGTILFMPFFGKFISFIEKIIPEKQIQTNTNSTVDKNIYLNGAATEFPITAIQALMKETKHMYENSIFVILKVFGLNQEDVEGKINLEDLKSKIKIYEGDIDKLYGEKIKILLGEILDYATKASGDNHEKYYGDFSRIKRANSNIAETIKTLKHMQKNLIRFTKSTNKEIVKQYERIIFDIIYTIQLTKDLNLVEKNEEKIKIIGKIEKYLHDNDIINNGVLDNLIRNKVLGNELATSLMKDANYKNDICNKLINSSEMVFNKEIFDETITEKTEKKNKKLRFSIFGNEKQVEKIIGKFKKRKGALKKKFDKEKDKAKKIEFQKQIEELEFIINKYKK